MLRWSWMTGWMAGLALAVALLATVRVEERRVGKEKARVTTLALQAVNATAERDSTRDVALRNAEVAAQLGDSLRIAERLVVQVAERDDALDQALGHERRARYRLTAAVDSLSQVARAASFVDASTGTREARFDLRQAPFTIAANVAIPAPPDSARLAIGVVLDSIPVDVRLGCAAPDGDGIRSASIDAVTPAWASVRFQRVEQASELCASPGLTEASRRPERQFAFTPLTVGFGRALSLDGRWSWALFLGGGFSSW
jgi:hypothetical protein